MTAPTMLLDPVEPEGSAVQVLEIAVAVRALAIATLATSALLVADPAGPREPTVDTSRTPAVSAPGTETLASEAVTGPPPALGSVTVGVGPDAIARGDVMSTLSP
jgi:hypothetical protein